ncbi:MAG TPA: SHOCT domain-containing protein [Candidatus Limnocylindrales bacterium]|nr:SHOCT domain-containing protein [Candidatus Limnocylindrales bacterium]
MSVSETLIPNESVVLEVKKHWIAPLRDSLLPIGLVVIAIVLGLIKPGGEGFLGFIGSVLGFIQVALVIAAGVWIVYNIIVWRTAEFAVTTLRVLRYEGFLQRRTSETLLSAVSDVKLDVGLVGKQLGYGDVKIMTMSGDAGADLFKSITQATEFRNAMMGQKMAEQTAARAPQAAAVAAAAAAAAPAPAPVAAAPAPAVPAPTAAEHADAIKKLADLRDQGLLTPEEFEAKKSEILARM